MIEPSAHNGLVVGSSPTGPTTNALLSQGFFEIRCSWIAAKWRPVCVSKNPVIAILPEYSIDLTNWQRLIKASEIHLMNSMG